MAEALTRDLSAVVAMMAEDIVTRLRAPGPAREKAEQLHRDERAGEAFDLWADLLARRAAVLWVLKSVYVRILEDRKLLRRPKLRDREAQELFEHLAPSLGETAFLKWVYRDLGSHAAGLADLFAPQPAEIVLPSNEMSRKLIDLWRRIDPDTGKLVHDLTGQKFSGRLMGDLYQDLDPVVKERYALLQTPEFIVDFILDQTLEPAIAEWGVDEVRVLDPSCGSGHFLLNAFRRLVDRTQREHPERPVDVVVKKCLGRVVGIDLNDYACALARARLVMTALELMGTEDITRARDLHPRVYWADGLEQVERDPDEEQLGFGFGEDAGEKSAAILTRPEVRRVLRPMLKEGFHVVVGNPPFDNEKDPGRKKYHKERSGGRQRYVSAHRSYSLVSPFVERCFQLSATEAYVGLLVANTFMKREFGKPLIQVVLARQDLTEVVDLTGVRITAISTALLFGRKRSPTSDSVRAVMGRRGDPPGVDAAETGPTWIAIREHFSEPGFENDFISVDNVERERFNRHPWSLGGGGAGDLKYLLGDVANQYLGDVSIIGIGGMSNADDVYIGDARTWERLGMPRELVRHLVVGEDIRNWAHRTELTVFFPYDDSFHLVKIEGMAAAILWPYRTTLWARAVFGGGTYRDAGRFWWEWHQIAVDRYRTSLSITYADVATHNHFVLDRGGKVFNRTAPVIKLPPDATDDDHFALLGLLNSSIADFWSKQVFHHMGRGGMGRGIQPEAWMECYVRDGSKLAQFPLIDTHNHQVIAFARSLDELARAQADDTARSAIDQKAEYGSQALRQKLNARRAIQSSRLYSMVWLQEELDWLCYSLYGLDPEGVPVAEPTHQSRLLVPGCRAFEITLARADADRRKAIADGRETDEQPTAWSERHGWKPVTKIESIPDDNDDDYKARVAARIDRTARSRELSLIEQPTYKRRWYAPDYEAEEQAALTAWLDDRIEAWARTLDEPFTVRQVVASLQDDPAMLAVCELMTGRRDFDLERVLGERIKEESVPNNKHRVYKPAGLQKRAAWEQTWVDQHREDRGEAVTPAVPPRYASSDFLAGCWRHRGKLDVPKERFIAYTEVPPIEGAQPLYGWAGWTPRTRARVLLEIDEKLEASGVAIDDRIGVLHGAWFLLPWVEWESKEAAAEFRAIITSFVGRDGITEEMLDRWAARGAEGRKGKVGGRRPKKTKETAS